MIIETAPIPRLILPTLPSTNLRITAPKTAGTDNKKDKKKAFPREKFLNRPPTIVEPEREIPGKSAAA